MILEEINKKKNEVGIGGIVSICSANRYVLKASMLFEKDSDNKLLIESTSNQVDQYGGYTGMTPIDFIKYVKNIANEVKFPVERIIFGGDHLGPNVWRNQKAEIAMQNTYNQIAAYVSAGYTKIHLDSSFALADDETNNGVLPPEVITERAARMCEVAEKTSNKIDSNFKPYYVIGTDVPIPGGVTENENSIKITTPDELEETIELTRKAFYKKGLQDAWERVIAVVVQPGVEFSDNIIFSYNKENNKSLIKKIEEYKGLYFEAHSTDYQGKDDLRNMVNDHFAILKVGPWLTFALRESLYSLSYIEEELLKYKRAMQPSNLIEIINNEMKANPKYWEKHYKGNENEIYIAKNFSYSDRVRYYWTNTTISNTVKKLINNLENIRIPESVVSQFLPNQYKELRAGKIINSPKSFIISKISEVLSIYNYAVGGDF